MEWPRCPRCRRDFALRSPVRNRLQRVARTVGLHRFHCQFCDHRFTAIFVGEDRAQTEEERRRDYERVPTALPAEIAWAGGQAEGTVMDLSIAGCSLRVASWIPAEGPFRLQFRIAAEVPPIAVDAAGVAYAGPGRLGLQFLGMRDEERDRLRQFVHGTARALKAAAPRPPA